MGYGSISGRAKTSARSPRAHAICDRCGFRFNHVDLSWQYDWRGSSLQNVRLLVCRSCTDAPQQQLRAIVISQDPVPIQNPRVQDFVAAETNYRITSGQNGVDFWTGIPTLGSNRRTTEEDNYRVTQTTGGPNGSLNTQPGTSIDVPDDAGGNDPGLPYGFDDVPETGPLG